MRSERMESVAGPWAKLERAREHVGALQDEFAAWSATLKLETVLDRDRSQIILKVIEVPDLPLRWSSILGDAIHNYRSVLDHLMWQLARANLPAGDEPPNTVQFPIVSDQARWPEQAFRVKSLSERHRHMIESLQPYHRGPWLGAGPPVNPLENLRDLSNIDKHRFVVVTVYGAGETPQVQLQTARGIRLGTPYYLVGLPIAPGTEVLKIDVVDLPHPDEYEVILLYQPSTYYALSNGAKVERILQDIDEAVDGILELFASEPSLLRSPHRELESPEEAEEVALRSLKARLPMILDRLQFMGRGLGVEMPDPYRLLRAHFNDLQGLWETEFSVSIGDARIRELVEQVFACRADLEEQGLREHEIEGLPALERVEPYPGLVMRLERVVGLLQVTVEKRLEDVVPA